MKKLNNKSIDIIYNIIISFFSTLALTINKTLVVTNYKTFLDVFKTDSLISGALFFGIFYFISKNKVNITEKRERCIILIFSSLLAIMFVIGSDITYTQSTFRGSVNNYSILLFFILLIAYYFMFKYFFSLVWSKYNALDKNNISDLNTNKKFNKKKYLYMLIPFIIIRLLFFIIFFPGVTTWDSMYIIGEGLGIYTFSNSHPYIYTYIVSLFTRFGLKYLGGVGIGVAIFNFLTMIITSIIIIYVLYKIFEFNSSKWLKRGLYLFYLLFPNFIITSFTMYKDVYLMNFLLLFFLCLIYIIYTPESFFNNKVSLVLFTISFFGVYMMHRKAVIYVAVGAIFLLIYNKKYFKQISKYIFIATIFTLLTNSVGMHLLKPTESRLKYDYLSPRFQQVAAVVHYHPESFTEEDLKFYDSILGLENNKNFLYYKADPIKNYMKNENFEKNGSQFFKLWWKGYKIHPKTYIDAILNLSVSYWYPYNYADIAYTSNYYQYMYGAEKNWFEDSTIILDNGWQQNLGNKTLSKTNIIFGHIHWSINDYPVLSLFYRAGLYTLILLGILMISILRKDKRIIPLILLAISIVLTCIYSPIVNYFRYSYIFIMIIPLLLPLILIKRN